VSSRADSFKPSRFKRLALEGGWIVLGQIAAVAGALVLVRVLTEYLAPTQYGQLALGLTLAGLVNQVVMGGITAGIGRFYSIASEKQALGSYLLASRQLLGQVTVAVVVVGALVIAGLLYAGASQWAAMATAALVLSILTGYNAAISSLQNAARQRAVVAFHSGLDAWLKIGLAAGAMAWLGTSSAVVIMGYACSSLLITASQLFFLRRTVSTTQARPTDPRVWLQQIWTYSMPFSIFGAFTWLHQASDRWALQSFASDVELGQYAVLYQLGFTPIALLTGMAMSFLGPILYQRSGDATDPTRNAHVHQMAWRMAQGCLLITLMAFLITLAGHRLLFGILVAAEFRTYSYLLPWMVLAGGIFAAGQMLALKLLSDMRSAQMTKAKIATAVFGLVLNVTGAWLAGVEGVVGAMLAFALAYLAWMAHLARQWPHETDKT